MEEKYGEVCEILDKLVEEGVKPDGENPHDIFANVSAIFESVNDRFNRGIGEKR